MARQDDGGGMVGSGAVARKSHDLFCDYVCKRGSFSRRDEEEKDLQTRLQVLVAIVFTEK